VEEFTNIAFYLAVIAYSVAATLFFLELARRDGLPLASDWAPRLLGFGAFMHAGQFSAVLRTT
jgi:hypothetical protein